MSIKKRFCLKNILSALVLTFAVGFTVFFFSPSDIFLGNQKEFLIGAQYIMLPMAGVSLAVSTGIFLFLIICLLIHKNIFDIFECLLFGFLCACYFQMLFFNGRMVSITGDITGYSEQNFYNYANFMLFFLLTVIPSILYAYKKTNKDRQFKILNRRFFTYVTGMIILIQSIGTATLFIQKGDENSDDSEYVGFLSYEPAMSLSKENNIVVFLTDRLDGDWLDTTFEKYPDIKDKLDGFTYYHNNISGFTNTFPSVAQMITGVKFDNTFRGKFLETVWEKHNVIDILNENDFSVNLLIDELATYKRKSQIMDRCDNYEYADCGFSINITGDYGVIQIMSYLSAMKISPYLAKDIFITPIPMDFSNYFVKTDEVIPQRQKTAVSPNTDVAFYNYLKENGLRADNSEKTYTFVHLNGVHGINRLVSSLYPEYDNSQGYDVYTTAAGEFIILSEYFEQMKNIGVFDNSTIIIVGDHGRPPLEIEKGGSELESQITTSLLIKPANAPRDAMITDYETPMHNDYFSASILEYAGIDHSEYGYSYNDIINYSPDVKRISHEYDFGGENLVIEYEVTGDAHDFNNWKPIKTDNN